MEIAIADYLEHYGTPRHSGRYPWGSHGWGKGEDTPQASPRHPDFLTSIKELRKLGIKDTDIAKGWGITSTQLRARISIANAEKRAAQISTIVRLKNKGMSNTAIEQQTGIPESTVRSLLKASLDNKTQVINNTSDMLKERVAQDTYVGVGAGVENYLGVSKEKLNAAISILREEGYVTHNVPVRQLGTGHDTKVKVLAPPGTTWGDVRRNTDKIKEYGVYSEDGGETFVKTGKPIAIHPDRLQVRYKGDGGAEADGVIYVRPGVSDISLGKSNYAQVRVQVGKDHYLKGMAMYKNDLPDGVDLVFNTSAESTGNKLDALKKISDNTPEFPYGAVVRQIWDDHPDPNKRKVISAMNIVNEEGEWKEWSRSIASQVLSKQKPALAKEQLDKAYNERAKDLEEINALTNPTVKKKLLQSFADDADSASWKLRAQAFNGQGWHAILPIDSIPPHQVYAPNYDNGTRVVLIRYPHGGTFEIPELVVNNKHPEAKALLKDAQDAIGIHHTVAQRLSGADFDGDTVLVIPNERGKITTSPALEGLKNFDPKSEYPPYDGMRTIEGGIWNEKKQKVEFPPGKVASSYKQTAMGEVSNLITDMTIKGAPHEHIARAVRHSMVVIDAEKHHLNYKLSLEQNGIADLKKEYQDSARGGAATIISKAKGRIDIPDRKPRPASLGGPINRETGALEFVPTGRKRKNKDGTVEDKTIKLKKLQYATNAHDLSSGSLVEKHYADYSNSLKHLANEARLSYIHTPNLKYSPSAKQVYAKEVQSLKAKLDISQRNAPRERQAQILANANVKLKKAANPHLDKDSIKKLEFAEIEIMRTRLGAKKKEKQIEITQEEWNAIQAGAITNNMLEEILKNTNLDQVRKYATPRRKRLLSVGDTDLAKRLLDGGATRAEVARRLGVSTSTLDRSVKGEE